MKYHPLYNQEVSNFTLQILLEEDCTVEGALILELAGEFLSTLVLPGCRPVSLWTKRSGVDPKLNMGLFTERRWKASQKKFLAGEFSVLVIEVENPDKPDQKIDLSIQVNPRQWKDVRLLGDIKVRCRLPYLHRLVAEPERVDALLRFGTMAWNGLSGGAAYGYANLAWVHPIVPFRIGDQEDPIARLQRLATHPAHRAHAIPIAYTGMNIDGNLASLICAGKGIKGAFWASYLSPPYVEMAGGEETIRRNLPGLRVNPLAAGGLLIVATPSPLPEDSQDNRQRFASLHRALQPAFLSRAETPENKRHLLGYFYRELPPTFPR
jgi:hypothetical protein